MSHGVPETETAAPPAEVPQARRIGHPPAPSASVSMTERVLTVLFAIACWVVLTTAFMLPPSPEGHGTHTQLGLAPCGFVVVSEQYFGGPLPCPSCGMTTSWAHASKGHVITSFLTQPFGFVLFCTALGCAIAGPIFAFRGRSLIGLLDRVPPTAGVLSVLGFGLCAWIYKIVMMRWVAGG